MSVIAPADLAELSETVAECARTGRALRPRGSGHEMRAGNPVDAAITVDTTRLDAIDGFDPDELVIRLGAGVTIAALHATLDAHSLRAIVPRVPEGRTVGGVIATASSGYERLRYGPIRNHVIGMTFVSGAGDVVRAGGRVVKNVTGFDLARMCVGSFGRLGVIAEVGLRVFPRRGDTAVVDVPDGEAAWRGAARPLAVISTRDGTVALVEGSDRAIAAQAQMLGGRVDAGASVPTSDRWAWRATLRSRPADQQGLLAGIPSTWEYIAQLGVGLTEIGGDAPVELAELQAARTAVEHLGGRLVLHRLPDELSGSMDAWGTPPPDIEIQRRIVSSFDPAGIFSPGILPGGL